MPDVPLPRPRPFGSLAPAMPIPQPDPRGSTFVNRLPKVPENEYVPFQAGEIPTYALLEKFGIKLNPDRLIIHPDDTMRMYYSKNDRQEDL